MFSLFLGIIFGLFIIFSVIVVFSYFLGNDEFVNMITIDEDTIEDTI